MKKNILFVLFICFCFFGVKTANCKNYAVLISGGHSYPDNSEDAAYWFDLVLAYEYLIENAGYEHEDIFVFFGDGTNNENTSVNNYRYKLSVNHQDWGDIVDFPNDPESVEENIQYFIDNILTEKDNLLIWWPRGHGSGNNEDQGSDNYNAWIYSTTVGWWYFYEDHPLRPPIITRIIYDILKFKDGNGNKKYKRIKYIWATCRSGHLLKGDKTLLNHGIPGDDVDDKIIIFTSADYNEQGIRFGIQGKYGDMEYHVFTYAVYCSLKGLDPWGNQISRLTPDNNNDGVISMKELWDAIKYQGNQYFNEKSWSASTDPDRHCAPQIGDPYDKAKYLYIDEVLKLKDHTLTLMEGEEVRKYRVDKVIAGPDLIIPDNSNIEFIVDSEVRFKPGFHAVNGSRLHAYFGEIDCP